MKKVGVVTFSKSINYGAYLQAFALQKVLKNFGVDASLVDYENPADKKRYRLIAGKTLKAKISSMLFLPVALVRRNNFRKAVKLLKYTPIDSDYDVLIAGSDQIWNPDLSGGKFDEKYFLNGINARRKISYAASVANEAVIDDNKEFFKKHIEKFDCVSVREYGTKERLSKLTRIPIFVAADPTLLLTKEEWDRVLINEARRNDPYIFSYFIGGLKEKESRLLTEVCKKLNMKCISYTKVNHNRKIYKNTFTDGPFDFLSRLRDSKLVITSSFHGVVLSIVLQKNFYYFLPRANRRSRIDNILKILGLTDRIIENEADIDKMKLDDIDYIESQRKLDAFRKASLAWLKSAIEGGEDE